MCAILFIFSLIYFFALLLICKFGLVPLRMLFFRSKVRWNIVCWWSVSLAGLWRHTGGCVSSAETRDAGDAHRAQAFLAGGQSPDDPCLYAGGDGCKLCQLENDWVAPLLQVSPAWVCSITVCLTFSLSPKNTELGI